VVKEQFKKVTFYRADLL